MGNLFSFSGCASRTNFWAVQLVSIACAVIGVAMLQSADSVVAVLGALLLAVIWWVSLAAQVRRLHDLNRTGWLVLLGLIPLVSLVMLIWMGFWPSVTYGNKYTTARSYYNGDQPRTNS